MPPLTLMPKFDIIQAKCTYGFTQTPLTSMNQKLALATVVSSSFPTKPNSQSNQIILNQNSMHQFSSTAKSSTLSCPLFKNLLLALVSSTAKMMCPLAMLYIKYFTSKFQHLFNFTTLSPTASSLTQLYNTDPNLRTCAFLDSWSMLKKTILQSLGNKKNTILLTIHIKIIPQSITF